MLCKFLLLICQVFDKDEGRGCNFLKTIIYFVFTFQKTEKSIHSRSFKVRLNPLIFWIFCCHSYQVFPSEETIFCFLCSFMGRDSLFIQVWSWDCHKLITSLSTTYNSLSSSSPWQLFLYRRLEFFNVLQSLQNFCSDLLLWVKNILICNKKGQSFSEAFLLIFSRSPEEPMPMVVITLQNVFLK